MAPVTIIVPLFLDQFSLYFIVVKFFNVLRKQQRELAESKPKGSFRLVWLSPVGFTAFLTLHRRG